MTVIYKIMTLPDWRAARRAGRIAPAEIDREDGYIHLSAEDQVLETARLHFHGRKDLVAVAFDAADFGDDLRWEASRGGALFPHLYADLPVSRAKRARSLIASGDHFTFGEDAT